MLIKTYFAGMTIANVPGDDLHTRHMDALRRVINMAKVVESPLVRIMTNKEQILGVKMVLKSGMSQVGLGTKPLN